MLKKLSTEALALIGSFTVFAGSVYNTERTIYNNIKNVELAHELELERMKTLQEKELTILESKNKSLELEVLLETLKQPNLNQSTLNPKSDSESQIGSQGSDSNLNDVLLNANQSNLLVLDHSNLINFSTSIILNSLIGLSAIISLVINYYIEKYGDQYKNDFPKWSLPILNFYINFTMYSNRYYIFILVLTQSFTLLIGIYLKFRNII